MGKKEPASVEVDRRTKTERRASQERRKQSEPVGLERRQGERREKVARRRQIDPTTCERDYTDDEVAFMQALDAYKRSSGRMFPTCSEILEVIRGLGYVRVSPTLTAIEPQPSEAQLPQAHSPVADATSA